MKTRFLLFALFATTTCFAQTTLWDGEDEAITSRNSNAGWWDRGNPVLVDNPDKSGINTSNKCLKFTMTGNDFGQKHVALPFRDWIQPNLEGNRRFSLMIKKSQNENVKVEISDPTQGKAGNGEDNYWEKTAAWYDGEGEWRKVVLDFSTNTNMNDFPGVFAIEAQTGGVNEPQDVYIDNIVIEPITMVNGVRLSEIPDGSLTGDIKVTGSMMRGDCQNANGDWFRVDYDDFAAVAAKMSSGVTSIDLSEAVLKNEYEDAFKNVNPDVVIYYTTPTGITSLTDNSGNSTREIYNLAGCKMADNESLPKGVYIINKKKVVIK